MEKISKIFLFLFIAGFLGLFIYGQLEKNNFEKDGKYTICKFTFCKQYPKTTSAYVKYFVNGKVYRNDCGRCPENFNQQLNKFFYLKYLPENPNIISVDFSNEIKDVKQILELESKLTFEYYLNN